MPEKPPMMPAPETPKLEKTLEDLTLPELKENIDRLAQEIEALLRQKPAPAQKKLSRGDELPDKEAAGLGEGSIESGTRQRSGRSMTGDIPLDRAITQKTQERARYQLRRAEILAEAKGEEGEN